MSAAPPPAQIFVLCTGRCGSTTFARAAGFASNYTAGHETRAHLLGEARLAYPPRHIEADNRLSWFLGRLDAAWGDNAAYVHLTRDRDAVAQSLSHRFGKGIMSAYSRGILQNARKNATDATTLAFCEDYVDTVTANIRAFLRDKTHVMDFRLETAEADFQRFWSWIGAEGNYEKALAQWSIRRNATKPDRG